MAVPKFKMSRVRTRRRRSHDALTAPTLIVCPNCGSKMMPHRVCKSCGQYKGRQVVALAGEDVSDDEE